MRKKGLKQNNKGFSMVELIIVMAIMAILVGSIAPQVFTYVEESRESKDLQIVDTVFTTVQTAIASMDEAPVSFSGDLDVALTKVDNLATLLADDIDTVLDIKGKAKSKDGKAGKMFVEYDDTTGVLKVYIGTAVGTATLGPIVNIEPTAAP